MHTELVDLKTRHAALVAKQRDPKAATDDARAEIAALESQIAEVETPPAAKAEKGTHGKGKAS